MLKHSKYPKNKTTWVSDGNDWTVTHLEHYTSDMVYSAGKILPQNISDNAAEKLHLAG